MKKWVKRLFFIFGGFFLLLILLSILIPIIFKKDIKAKIDEEIAKSVNAQVYFDIDKFGLNMLSNFPNITVSMEDFGIVGKDRFKGDTLTAVKEFEVEVDIWSVIFGSQIKVKGIYLDSPKIYAKVLKDGTPNWDIAKADTTQKEEKKPDEKDKQDTTKTNFNIGIKRWKIKNAQIVYADEATPMYASIQNLTHKGSGNFTQAIFDLKTKTTVDKIDFGYQNISYVEDKSIDIDLILNMDLEKNKFTFKKNAIKINEFVFGFDGFVQVIGKDIKMDIKYVAKENEFKNILSMVPGVYTEMEEFKKMKTQGKFAFDGFVKGIYNEKQYPAFNFNFKIADALFQYPDLPTPINNINVDVSIDNKTGDLEKTLVNLKKFHLDLGKNPVDAKARVEGLSTFKIDANVMAKLNLADLGQMFPMPGLTVKGLFGLNATAKGIYNASTMPNLAANLTLRNGYVKTKEFPEALDKLSLDASVSNTTGDYKDSKVAVKDLSWTLDGKPFSVKANVENFADITYDAHMKGILDLAKITHIYPLEGMTLAGIINADINTAGKMSYIDKEEYDKLPTSGKIDVNNFSFVSKADLPQGFKITEAITRFTPQTITLEKFNGFLGKSDIHATGTISNYIAYIFKEHTVKGKVNFTSNKFIVDEWMASTKGQAGNNTSSGSTTTATPTTQPTASDTTAADEVTLVEVPKNIDFVLDSNIGEIDYEDLEIKNIRGKIIVKDGRVILNGLKFNMLEGGFTMSGAYDTYDVTRPKYDFKMNINRLSIGKAHSNFSVVKKLIPMAKNITGFLSTDLKIGGGLSQYMTPLLDNSLNGFGWLKLTQTEVKGSSMLRNLSVVTGIQELKELKIDGVNIRTEIRNGKMTYQPFNLKVGNYSLNVRGSNGVDGTLDFKVDVDAPKGKIGQNATNAIGRLTGINFEKSDRVNVKLGITGAIADPKVKVIGSSVQDQVKKVVDNKIEEGKDKAKQVLADAQKKADAIMAEARQKVDAAKADARKKLDEAKKLADAEYNKFVADKLKEVQNPLLKAVAQKAAEKAGIKIKQQAYSRAEHEFQKYLKLSDKIMEEAETRRKKVMEEANKKVDNVNKKK